MPPETLDRQDNTVLHAVLDLTNKVNEIKTDLAINTTETRNIVQRLDKLNGSVAKHDTAISLNEQAIALLTQTITKLSAMDDKRSVQDSSWRNWLYKGLVIIGLYLLYSVLTKTGIVAHFLLP